MPEAISLQKLCLQPPNWFGASALTLMLNVKGPLLWSLLKGHRLTSVSNLRSFRRSVLLFSRRNNFSRSWAIPLTKLPFSDPYWDGNYSQVRMLIFALWKVTWIHSCCAQHNSLPASCHSAILVNCVSCTTQTK